MKSQTMYPKLRAYFKEEAKQAYSVLKKDKDVSLKICILEHISSRRDITRLYDIVKGCSIGSKPYKGSLKQFHRSVQELSSKGMVEFEADFIKKRTTPLLTEVGRNVLVLLKNNKDNLY